MSSSDPPPEAGGSVFHTEGWLRMLEKSQGYKIYRLESGGFLPLALVRSRVFGDRLISIPFSDYGGPIAANTRGLKKLTDEARKLTEELNVDFTEIRTLPSGSGVPGLAKRDDYCTFVMDLRKKGLFQGLEKRVRNGITKAQREGVTVKGGGKADVKDFYMLYVSTVMRLGSPPQALGFFESMLEELGKNVQMRFAIWKGRPIAAAIFLTFGKHAYYSYSCSDKDRSALRGNDLLLWDAIETFSSGGYERFHFGRTRPGSGVYFYKRGWGGKEIPMPYYYIFHRKVLKQRQELAYSKASDLWKKAMPTSLAVRLGPKLIRQIG
jgi:lipid II:glycine glycyltransferase (peptidoglycan interpeptide bridge formation enzyme)